MIANSSGDAIAVRRDPPPLIRRLVADDGVKLAGDIKRLFRAWQLARQKGPAAATIIRDRESRHGTAGRTEKLHIRMPPSDGFAAQRGPQVAGGNIKIAEN